MTLIEQARKQARNKRSPVKIGPEQIELALGWLRGEFGMSAVNAAVRTDGKMTLGPYSLLARALREAYAQGRLVDKREPASKPRSEYP